MSALKKGKFIIALLTLFVPWPLRRLMLNKLLGYQIHHEARIGISIIYPKSLVMGKGSRIGNLNYCKGLSLLELGEESIISNLNWITAVSTGALAFREEKDRQPMLVLGKHAAITNRHLIDCTNAVTIGKFSTFAGFRSQILTHAINLELSRQESAPVSIGEYCFVGTGVVILAGSVLPSYSVLAASATLMHAYDEEYMLYAGVPAKPIKQLSAEMEYFKRNAGFVN